MAEPRVRVVQHPNQIPQAEVFIDGKAIDVVAVYAGVHSVSIEFGAADVAVEWSKADPDAS